MACRDPGLESRLRAYFGNNITAAHLKMTEAPQGQLPTSAVLCDNDTYSNSHDNDSHMMVRVTIPS